MHLPIYIILKPSFAKNAQIFIVIQFPHFIVPYKNSNVHDGQDSDIIV